MDRTNMDCPDCLAAGTVGSVKIGNNRASCKLCNRWAGRVRVVADRLLRKAHPDEYDMIRRQAERDVYEALI